MQTFREVAEAVRLLDTDAGADGPWPAGFRPGARVPVPAERPWVLPRDPDGYAAVDCAPGSRGLPELGPHDREATSALIGMPALAVGLRRPTEDELASLGYDVSSRRPTHEPRAIGTAVALQLPDGVVYGVGRTVAVEGGLRPGSTVLLGHAATWSAGAGADAAEEELARLHLAAADTVRAQAEPSARPWRTLVVLLGDADPAVTPDRGWKRGLELAAGLRGCRLQIRTNPDSFKSRVVRDLRSTPPDGLLVWRGGLASPESYIAPYLATRPDGYAETFGGAGSFGLEDQQVELLMHLRAMAPDEAPGPAAETPSVSWTEARTGILALAGEHFVLTARARAMLDGNPYPDPGRMLWHMTKLAALALQYAAGDGALGARLADVAIEQHGIEVALTDKSLSLRPVAGYGALVAEPHVKVDDAKSPDKVGRIYFAIDTPARRFVVDQIGLHDY